MLFQLLVMNVHLEDIMLLMNVEDVLLIDVLMHVLKNVLLLMKN